MTAKRYLNKEKFNDLLFHNKINKKELAEKAGIDPNYMYQITSGKKIPGNKTAGAIADALGVKPDVIFLKSLYPKVQQMN